jgi:hypothetical protein
MTRLVFAALATLPLAPVALGQGNFDQPPPFPPDDATLKQIAAKTAELRTAVENLRKPAGRVPTDVWADVLIYLKAAEWIVRHNEFYVKDSGKQTLAVLDAGLIRAKAANEGKTPWRDVRGKPIVRGCGSEVDDSVQPFSVTLPEGYGQDDKKYRLDVVLHGRDATLTEVKFIHAREAAKPAPKGPDRVVLEIYGRGNNAYRWAGETDVTDAIKWFVRGEMPFREPQKGHVDLERIVLRGFSMGGAGTWHYGLHHPFMFAVIGPGAGFTTTRGYIRNLPAKLPDYQEACLHIYDAVDYAENAFNVPVVAYSGDKDPQKAAADGIEAALKTFDKPVRFTHVVAPGLEHRQPPEWQAKLETEYRKHLDKGRAYPEHVRFVTYTTRYNDFGHGSVEALDRHYVKAVVDSRWTKDALTLATTNVRALTLIADEHPYPAEVAIDGQRVKVPKPGERGTRLLVKADGTWSFGDSVVPDGKLAKRGDHLQGPIDDAFRSRFVVSPPEQEGLHAAVTRHAAASADRFAAEWDKYFRGRVQTRTARQLGDRPTGNLVLFGDPGSNPLLAKVVQKLPITWTKDKLVVNGVEYDPKTHVPVLIYPNPLNPSYYVVINSGHTFRAADLKGTNALLYPRLGDWAVLKVAPTEKDPAAAEVVAAGLFDEFWQFPKK